MDKDNENHQKLPAEEKLNVESNVALFNLSTSVCETVIGGNVLGLAKMPDNDDDTPPGKKRKASIKRCRMCGTTSGKIVSNACAEHLEAMRKKNATQKYLNNKKKWVLWYRTIHSRYELMRNTTKFCRITPKFYCPPLVIRADIWKCLKRVCTCP